MDLITVEEVASKLKVKPSWVYTHASRLGAFRLGKYLRFSWPRVLDCLEQTSLTTNLLHNASERVHHNPGHDPSTQAAGAGKCEARDPSERPGRVIHREEDR